MIRTSFVAVLALVALASNAEARQRHKATGMHPLCNITMPCVAPYNSTPEQARVTRGRYVARSFGFGAAIEKKPRARRTERRSGAQERLPAHTAAIVSHPAGCPARAFCACGAAVRVFGSPIRSLWLAANWFKFPRTSPAPGAVAVRRHHVFVLEQHLGGDTWLVYDANSGGRQTRIHARSIAGYSIVNPHGGAA